MDAGLLVQYLIVALAVLASAGYVVWTRMPRQVRRVRGRLALRLVDSSSPRWQRLGRRIAPPPAAGSACGGCNGCD